MNLLETLKALDPTDDSLWTDDGLPALDAVKAITGDKKLTRQALNDIALGLTRTNVAEYTPLTKGADVQPEEVIVEETVELDDRIAREREAVAGFLQTATEQRLSDAEKLAKLQATGLSMAEIIRLVTKRNLKNVRVA
jgi:hypothetical protein